MAELTKEDLEVAKLIADLGGASETELQARTMRKLKELREEIDRLEGSGLVRRRRGAFKGGYGDALELTELGYRSLK